MTLGSCIVIGGLFYASACRLAGDVSELGITRGRTFGLGCLLLGICVDLLIT